MSEESPKSETNPSKPGDSESAAHGTRTAVGFRLLVRAVSESLSGFLYFVALFFKSVDCALLFEERRDG